MFMARENGKKTTKEKTSKLDRPLTLGGFLDGLDRFYEGKIEPRFVSIEAKLSEHDKKFVSIEAKLSEHDERFEEINGRFEEVNGKFDEVNGKFDEIYNHIDGLYKKFEDLKIEYFAIKAALDRIERYIKQDIEDKKMLRQEINKIKADIHSLTIRVEDLEKQIST